MTLVNSGLTLAVYWIGAYMIEAAGVSDRLGIFSDMVVFSNYAMQVIMAFMMLNMTFILLPAPRCRQNGSVRCWTRKTASGTAQARSRRGREP